MEKIENRMVVDSEWENHYSENVKEKLDGSGYTEIGTGIFIAEEDAFNYAIEQCVKCVSRGFRDIDWTDEFKEMIVEWFYSGNWVKEDWDGTN